MTTYDSIKDFKRIYNSNSRCKNKGLEFNNELISLLELLEEVNPCQQQYDLYENNIVISYELKINLLNFFNIFPLFIKTRVIGLPISISEKAYWGEHSKLEKIIRSKKGLKILLNGDESLGYKGRTLSTFIFNNDYSSFKDYLNNLRSPYRRRINKALEYRKNLIIKDLKNNDFSNIHYSLYKSIMDRTENPLEILSMDFFTKYDSEIYEFLHRETKEVLGFIQVKQFKETLYFLFCGFKKEDNYNNDLYYNMLLKILEIGIERGIKKINFGQTSEESKLKIGCIEVPKYLCIYHSNFILNKILQLLLPVFSYKPYGIKHNVFKNPSDFGGVK